MSEKPWLSEPLSDEFECEGYTCVCKRFEINWHWCAYVLIPEGHCLHGKGYFDNLDCLKVLNKEYMASRLKETTNFMSILLSSPDEFTLSNSIDVHGGVTWSDYLEFDNGRFWCIGFDCGHPYDFSPVGETHALMMLLNSALEGEKYKKEWRSLEYVREECKKLVEQIKFAEDYCRTK